MVQTNEETASQVPVTSTIQQGKWKKKSMSSTDEMVTLTKSQLRAILEAIGQIGQSGTLNLTEYQSQQSQDEIDENIPVDISPGTANHHSSRIQRSASYSHEVASCPSRSGNFECNAKGDFSYSALTMQSSSSTSKLSMSRLEQKRLQWDKERAEMQEWNPWGKPGAGAPRPKGSTAPKSEPQVLVVHSSSNSFYPTLTRSTMSSPHHTYNSTCGTPHGSQSPNLTAVSQPVMVPARSSLPFAQNNMDEIEERKQQWYQDLERQREEDRQRHLIEQDRRHLSRQLDDHKVENSDNSTYPFIDNHTSTTEERIYLRGQGFTVNPEDVAKAQERRQKALDYQKEVKQQMEEKRQKDQEEKKRKILEEQEEEKRLEEERARMQKEYEDEQCRLKEKEEQEEKKRRILIAAMEEAQAAADAARKVNKAQKKQQSNLESLPLLQKKIDKESVIVPNSNVEKNISENDDGKGIKIHQQTAMVYPMQNDNTSASYSQRHREFAVQTNIVSESSEYIENRVLTPTVVRMRERTRNKNKEFGTQTDFDYINQWVADDGDSAVSTSSSVTSTLPCRKNRIQHSKPTKASQKSYDPIQNQSKWGVPPPQKTFVKMSERDPHYPKRKKLLELRRQHWEREMASQRSLSETRKSIFSSHSSSKSLSRNAKLITSSEGSLSSSETDEKYLRGNGCTVPRFVRKTHYRHSHGSADDVMGKMGDKENELGFHSDSHSVSRLQSRLTQSTDNLLYQHSEIWPRRGNSQSTHFPDGRPHHPSMRKKWHSQETFSLHTPNFISHSCVSPPVPAQQKKLGLNFTPVDTYHVPRRKWSDQESYKLDNMTSSHTKHSFHGGNENGGGDGEKPDGDPLVHPEIVTRRPTPRQDKILMQLSSLRQGLLLKQRELENLLRNPVYDTS